MKRTFLALLLCLPTVALATGQDSPPECLNPDDKVESAPWTIEAPAGKVIDYVCLKSGNETFGELRHSGPIVQSGIYGCGFSVNLFEPAVAMANDDLACKDLSHMEAFFKDAPPPPPPPPPGGDDDDDDDCGAELCDDPPVTCTGGDCQPPLVIDTLGDLGKAGLVAFLSIIGLIALHDRRQ